MKTIRNITRLVGLAAVAALMFVPRAEATTISITPPAVTTNVGSSFSVDVIVSGLTTQGVGGASFLVSFNDALIKGTTFTLDPDHKMGPAAAILDFGSGFTGAGNSPFEAFFVADATLNNAALLALQGTGFRLATLNFNAVAAGQTGLNLSFEPLVGAFLSNADGFVLPANSANACVTVLPQDSNIPSAAVPCGAVSAVPEPATFGLLATGLATVLARRRRKTQA